MCFDHDSIPPIPALAGAAVEHRDLVLEAADGNRFAAFAALPERVGAPAVVVLPDVRGLYRFYEELALRLAEHGHAAVAFDYFGRTAGVARRGEDFEYPEHVKQTTPEGVQADMAACVAWLRSQEGGRHDTVVTLGFCFGGRHSWLAGAGGHGIAGAIGFYGRPGPGNDGAPGPAQRASELEAPILGLMGGADQAIPQSDVDAFEEALRAAGVEHELVVYPGAPHSFFDRKQTDFQEASDDAWRRVLSFLQEARLPARA
jgi:carboxymethylenebutenolidase